MRVLVAGANGFIGAHVAAALREAGHDVVPATRRPMAGGVAVDFNADTDPAIWAPRLAGIDAVVNCVGVLQDGGGQSSDAIHHRAPQALFAACAAAGVRRVIHVSAISADPQAGTDYADSKRRGEDALRATALDWVVLRPSLVYAAGSYGGTSLLRGLAGLPLVTPLAGDGAQPFSPIHAEDLARAVRVLLERPGPLRLTLEPVGPERLTMAEILAALRSWLGFAPARPLRLPLGLVRAACRLGDLTGAGPLRSTSLAQLQHGNAAPAAPFVAAIGFTPRRFADALAGRPAQVQDRWHARLYFVRPLLTAALALLWLVSGLVGLGVPASTTAALLGLPAGVAGGLGIAASLLDLAIAAAVASGRHAARVGTVQIAVVLGYTIVLTLAAPALWLDPFGPLLKNLPTLAAVLAWMAMGEDR